MGAGLFNSGLKVDKLKYSAVTVNKQAVIVFGTVYNV